MSFFPIGAGPTPNAASIRSTTPPGRHPLVQDADTRLRKSALQLEGLFVQRLFAAMRETVPDDGLVTQSNAQSTFTEMLDEKLAEQVPTQWSGSHSLAEALYQQLRQRLSPPATESSPSHTASEPPR
jgi:peptidoglycan hydrolase FlgJ